MRKPVKIVVLLIVFYAISALAVWGIGAFVAWNADVSEWHQSSRMGAVFLWVVALALITVFVSLWFYP